MPTSDRVKCFIRIRPSSNFAHENIEILPGPDPETKNKIIQLKSDQLENSISRGISQSQPADNSQKSWKFKVDDVLYNASQDQVFDTVAKNLVVKALDGYSGTLVAYGESGSGKTFTLSGARDHSDFAQRGLSPRAIGHIFQHINSAASNETTFNVSISYLEISGNKLTDLLVEEPNQNHNNSNSRIVRNKKLEIFEDDNNPGSTKVDGLSVIQVKSETDAFKYFLTGDKQRSRGSHSIFTIYISSKSQTVSGGTIKYAELKFVDLCSWGSTVNQSIKAASVPSLSFLEQVIIALKSTKYDSIPWRSCTLTHVLKGNFQRRSTVLLGNIYGDKIHLQGSLTSLRFSARLNNMPVEEAHTEVNDANSQVKVLKDEIQKLKCELKMRYIFNRVNDKSAPCSNYEPLTEKDIENMQTDVKNYLAKTSNHLDTISLQHVNKLFELMREEFIRQEVSITNKLKAKYTFIERADKSDNKDGNTSNSNNKSSNNSDKNSDKNAKNSKNDKKDSKDSDKKKDSKSDKSKKGGSDNSSHTSVIGGRDSGACLTTNNNSSSSNQLLKNSETEIHENGSNTKLCHSQNKESLQENFEEFKKNAGRNTYHNILNSKKLLDTNRKQSANIGNSINKLVDDIQILDDELNSLTNNSDIISEAEFTLRQNLAKQKTQYITLKNNYENLQTEEIALLSELESLRRKLLTEFTEDNQSNDQVYELCAGLPNFSKDGFQGANVIFQNESTQPPFAIPEQNDQGDPSFEAWNGARLELATSLRNSGKMKK